MPKRNLQKDLSMRLFFAILFLILPQAGAKIAGVGEVPYVIEKDASDITVDADGRSTLTREAIIRIVNDQGRESQSVQTLTFNSRAQAFKILEAATLNGPPDKAVRTAVPARDIEIKEVGQMSQAFDSIKQASLSYPKVQVGSRLRLKYQIRSLEIPIKGFWSAGFSISGDVIESFQLHIRSKLPLHYRLNDDRKRFVQSISKSKTGWTTLDIRSASPLLSTIVQEENAFQAPDRIPTIAISSLPDWSSYGGDMLAIHEAILKKPLPPALEAIRKKADTFKTPVDRIQSVAASIAQDFRYFGDWRRRHGGYVPRSLQEIADSRYGDCKDLAIAVTAIFRALGYKANLAWIYRGEVAPPAVAYEVPVDSNFNHAIARVEVDGHVYWVDATDPVAYARGIYADIADRPAFVLDAGSGQLDRTPPLTAAMSTFSSHLAYEFQKDESVNVSGDVKLGGRAAIGLTARAFYSPVEAVNYEIIRMLANNGKVSDAVVGDFERGSRVVQDVTIPVKFKLAESGLRTSAGLGYPLFRDDSVSRLLVETKDRISDIYLESPNTSTSVIDLMNVRRVGRTSLDCTLTSPWLDLQRRVTDLTNGVSVADTVVVKASVIPNAVLSGAEFTKFQNDARACFNRAAVIVELR